MELLDLPGSSWKKDKFAAKMKIVAYEHSHVETLTTATQVLYKICNQAGNPINYKFPSICSIGTKQVSSG